VKYLSSSYCGSTIEVTESLGLRDDLGVSVNCCTSDVDGDLQNGCVGIANGLTVNSGGTGWLTGELPLGSEVSVRVEAAESIVLVEVRVVPELLGLWKFWLTTSILDFGDKGENLLGELLNLLKLLETERAILFLELCVLSTNVEPSLRAGFTFFLSPTNIAFNCSLVKLRTYRLVLCSRPSAFGSPKELTILDHKSANPKYSAIDLRTLEILKGVKIGFSQSSR